MKPLHHYIGHSLIIHGVMLGLLIIATLFGAAAQPKTMTFVILPKGTSMDAVLTKEVAEAIKNKELDPASATKPLVSPSPSPASSPTPIPEPTKPAEASAQSTEPSPTPAPTPEPDPTPAPSPTPIKLATPTPPVTPAPSAVPQKTIAVAPKGTPEPTATPKPTESPKPTATPAPKKTATPKPTEKPKKKETPVSKKTPNAKDAKKTAKATPVKTPKPTPKQVASAYDIAGGKGRNRFADATLPGATPSNVKVGEAAPGQEVGVPGIAEGVEGAPLPLDRNQSMLSMLYTNRARMRIQSNFTVPPGVNDPTIECVVEWEILPDGTLQNIRIQKSSGFAQYDSCALDALRKTGNIGPLPPEFGKKSVWTSLTFVFAGE